MYRISLILKEATCETAVKRKRLWIIRNWEMGFIKTEGGGPVIAFGDGIVEYNSVRLVVTPDGNTIKSMCLSVGVGT